MKDFIGDFKGFVKMIFIILMFIVLTVSLQGAYTLYLNGDLFEYIYVNGAAFVLVGIVMIGNIISSLSKIAKINKLEKSISLKAKEIKELKSLIKEEA